MTLVAAVSAYGASMKSRLAAIVFVLLLAPALAAAQEPKALRGVALVVGQSKYQHLSPLPNPANDADAIEALLSDLGFESVRRSDRAASALARDLERFAEDAEGAEVAVLYYSGHGIEAGGENFLIPVDADLSSLDAAGEKLVPVSALVERLKATVPVVIVMLDACRDNPFPAGSFLRASPGAEPMLVGAGGLGLSRGAASLRAGNARTPAADANIGTVIAFAAEPGRVALDGVAGGNSPYAAALLRHFDAMAGEEFGTVMRMVAEEVYLRTQGQQRPWINESLRRLLYFGERPAGIEGDEGEILTERRQLLVTIAALPDRERQAVERIAANGSLPMDAVYGMLRALGQDAPEDPAALEELLAEQARRIKTVMADRTILASSDADIDRLSRLARSAVEEGALETAIRIHDRAKARVAELEGTIDDAEAQVRARRLEFAKVFLDSGSANEMAFRYEEAAGDYEQAFRQAERWDDATALVARSMATHALGMVGRLEGKGHALQQAKAAGEDAVELARRLPLADNAPRDLVEAVAKLNLAMIQSISGSREIGSQGISQAIDRFREVNSVLARYQDGGDHGLPANIIADLDPLRRAGQAELSRLLAVLAERDRAIEPLLESIAIQKALIESSGSAETLQRTVAQIGLGHRLRLMADVFGDSRDLLAFMPTLRVAALQPFPDGDAGWIIETRRSLCDALVSSGRHVPTIEEAISLFTECVALARRTLELPARPETRLQRADMQNTLAIALMETGRREDGFEMLEQSVAAFRVAMVDINRDSGPAMWMRVGENLAHTLGELARRSGDPDALRQAIAVKSEIAAEWAAQKRDEDWAEVQVEIAALHQQIGEMTGDVTSYRTAIDHIRSAMTAWPRESSPLLWSIGHARLGDAIRDSAFAEENTLETLRSALDAYDLALEEATFESVPRSWLRMHWGRAEAAGMIAQFTDSAEFADRAMESYRQALDGYGSLGDQENRAYFESRLKEMSELVRRVRG